MAPRLDLILIDSSPVKETSQGPPGVIAPVNKEAPLLAALSERVPAPPAGAAGLGVRAGGEGRKEGRKERRSFRTLNLSFVIKVAAMTQPNSPFCFSQLFSPGGVGGLLGDPSLPEIIKAP